MKRAGGWILALLVVGAMAGGGWFALRRVVRRETVAIILLKSESGRGPTDHALQRGAQVALGEASYRAGRYRVALEEDGPGRDGGAAWIGTSEALVLKGDRQPAPFFVSAFDTHPPDPAGCFRVTPGCDQQGRAAASWAGKSGAARIFLLRDTPSLRSKAIADAFGTSARALGLSLEGPVEASVDAVDRILASKADLVFYSGEEAPYATAFKVFSALRERGFAGTLLMGEADPEVSFLATRPSLVDGTYLVSPFAPAPADLAARMGSVPGPHVTAGYYAMRATLEALDQADSAEPEALRRAAATLPYFDAQGRAALRTCALYVARNGVFDFVEVLK